MDVVAASVEAKSKSRLTRFYVRALLVVTQLCHSVDHASMVVYAMASSVAALFERKLAQRERMRPSLLRIKQGNSSPVGIP